MVIIKQYKNENYSVLFNQKTGCLARVEKQGFLEPEFSRHGPELLDISITNWCDKGCTFCYRNSNIDGKHMSLKDYKSILNQASECDVFQIALGGGNPNQHPDFIEILKATREKNIIPSYTTNGRGLTSEIITASKKYCGAIAVSYYGDDDFFKAIEVLKSNEIKTNIHFLLSSETIGIAIKWLEEKPEFLNEINAVVFLNYKPVGKFKDKTKLLNNSKQLANFFDLISKNNFKFKIGFDSCTISYISRYLENIDDKYIESCESGRFSAFIDENLDLYPCSFMVKDYNGISLKSDSLLNKWINSKQFNKIREKELDKLCIECKTSNICNGGCPIFKEINSCNEII